ncbi:MAG: ester cyclase [Bauldia sp.]
MSNRAVAESYFANISRNLDMALAAFAPGAEFVAPIGPVPFPDGVRMMLQGYNMAFPGHAFEVKRWIEDGDTLVAEGTWVGRHTGTMLMPGAPPVPATGMTVRAPFVTILQMKNGKIASHRAYWDLAGFMGQLGIAPRL